MRPEEASPSPRSILRIYRSGRVKERGRTVRLSGVGQRRTLTKTKRSLRQNRKCSRVKKDKAGHTWGLPTGGTSLTRSLRQTFHGGFQRGPEFAEKRWEESEQSSVRVGGGLVKRLFTLARSKGKDSYKKKKTTA